MIFNKKDYAIDWAEIYTINIPIDYMPMVNKMLEPTQYIRLNHAPATTKKDDNNKNKKDKKEELDEYKNELIDLKDRYKSLMALSNLYMRIRKTQYVRDKCPLRLNTMLAIELYMTFSYHANTSYKKYTDLEKKAEGYRENRDLEKAKETEEEAQQYYKNYDNLKEITECIVQALKPEMIYPLIEACREFTVEEHANKCVI